MIRRFRPVREMTPERAMLKQKRRLRRIGMLPTLLTLGNLCFGVGALWMCCREVMDLGAGNSFQTRWTMDSKFLEYLAPSYLSIGVWMLIAAIICDALDGRVARKTGAESKFGEQMDSLADMVSWGVAPALMMMTLVKRETWQWLHLTPPYHPFGYERFGQLTVLIGLIYVSCTALRLARFNVETSLEAASHEGFRGLPSPGAGGLVLALVFLHDHLEYSDWLRTADVIVHILPFCTLGVALLMVSNVPYRHMGSVLLKRRPFSHVILFLLALPLVVMYVKQVAALFAIGFVLSGLVAWVRDAITGKSRGEQQPPEAPDQPADYQPTKKSV